MKIKIIKRAASEKNTVKIPAAENNQLSKTDERKAAEAVKLWIDDLRQKSKLERLSINELFGKEHCT